MKIAVADCLGRSQNAKPLDTLACGDMTGRMGKIEKTTELVLDAATELAKNVLEPSGTIGVLLKDAGMALVPGLGGAVASLAVKTYAKRLERRLDEWLGLVAMYLGMGAISDASTFVSEHIDEEWAHQGVAEGVRAILNDLDDAALPSLARLVAWRMKSRKFTIAGTSKPLACYARAISRHSHPC
jgi:hypothetical protein